MIKGFPKDRRILIWTADSFYAGEFVTNFVTGATGFRVGTHDDGTQVIIPFKKVIAWAEAPERPANV